MIEKKISRRARNPASNTDQAHELCSSAYLCGESCDGGRVGGG